MRTGRTTLTLALALSLAGSAFGQPPEAPSEPRAGQPEAAEAPEAGPAAGLSLPAGMLPAFGGKVEVREVALDVCVRDRRGRPVHDLEARDFEVRLDGLRMALAAFSRPAEQAASGEEPEADEEVEPAEEAESAEQAEAAFLAEREPEPLHIAFLLDQWGTRPADRARIMDDVERLLSERLARGDRVMVATASPGLEVRQPFTDDPEAVRAALHAEAESASFGLEDATHLRSTLDGIATTIEACLEAPELAGCEPCEDVWGVIFALGLDYAASRGGQVHQTLSVLERLVSGLAPIEGPKLLVYVGEGLEQRPGSNVFQYLQEQCPSRVRDLARETARLDESQALTRLARRALDHRVSFVMVDPGGLRTYGRSSVEHRESLLVPSPQVEIERMASVRDSLHLVAHHTGGKAILHSNAPGDELLEAARERAACYTLSFRPPDFPPGTSHRLDVDVPGRGGLTVTHRPTYRVQRPEETWIARLQAALLLGDEHNPLGVRVAASEEGEVEGERVEMPGLESAGGKEAEGGKRGARDVPVVVRVPWDSLTLLGSGSRQGLVRLLLAVAEQDALAARVREKMFAVTVGADEILGDDKVFTVPVPLPRGEHAVAVAVLDELSGEGSFLHLPLEVR